MRSCLLAAWANGGGRGNVIKISWLGIVVNVAKASDEDSGFSSKVAVVRFENDSRSLGDWMYWIRDGSVSCGGWVKSPVEIGGAVGASALVAKWSEFEVFTFDIFCCVDVLGYPEVEMSGNDQAAEVVRVSSLSAHSRRKTIGQYCITFRLHTVALAAWELI